MSTIAVPEETLRLTRILTGEDDNKAMFFLEECLIKVGGREIATNALEDEIEAERILTWLKDQINEAWENQESIVHRYDGRKKPKIIKVLMLLPGTNCKKYGRPANHSTR